MEGLFVGMSTNLDLTKKITGRFDLILKLPVKSNLFWSLSYKQTGECVCEREKEREKEKETGRFDLIWKLPVKSNLFWSLFYK